MRLCPFRHGLIFLCPFRHGLIFCINLTIMKKIFIAFASKVPQGLVYSIVISTVSELYPHHIPRPPLTFDLRFDELGNNIFFPFDISFS